MPEFTVEWTIELTADTPLEAAQIARSMQLNPDAKVGYFVVTDEDGCLVHIDLDAE